MTSTVSRPEADRVKYLEAKNQAHLDQIRALRLQLGSLKFEAKQRVKRMLQMSRSFQAQIEHAKRPLEEIQASRQNIANAAKEAADRAFKAEEKTRDMVFAEGFTNKVQELLDIIDLVTADYGGLTEPDIEMMRCAQQVRLDLNRVHAFKRRINNASAQSPFEIDTSSGSDAE